MVAHKALSALLFGAGAVVALPHAGHHGHCGSKCSTSSGVVATSAAVVASTGVFPTAPLSTGAFGTGVATGTDPVAKAASTGTVLSSAVSSVTSSTASASSGSAAGDSTNSTSGTAPVESIAASSGCTFTDAAAAIAGKAKCASIVLSGITVPAGTTLDMTGLADGTTLTFEGTTTFEYKEWEGPLISIAGTNLKVQGADGHVIDGNGAKWWDGKGGNGGVTKPKFCNLHKMTDSVVTGLNVLNTPVQGFSINGASNLQINDVTIDNSAGDGADGGHNTDAFDVGSSTGVYISGANIKNQDDCLAINSGTDISFTGGTCSGGHGLSIGSVGGRSDNEVANIYISDNTISASDNGVRIKTVSGETGSVKNVTYSNIKLENIAKYGIVIEQDYENGSPTGTPTSGVPITDVTIENVTGTVASGGNDVYILCASCSDWTWTGVDITGGKTAECKGVPTGASC